MEKSLIILEGLVVGLHGTRRKAINEILKDLKDISNDFKDTQKENDSLRLKQNQLEGEKSNILFQASEAQKRVIELESHINQHPILSCPKDIRFKRNSCDL